MVKGRPPTSVGNSYGRKPYIPGQHDDQKELMKRPPRSAIENQRESPRSIFDKPYMDDTGDYQAMEHWQPDPLPLSFPDINLQVYPFPGPVPAPEDWGVDPGEACFINCKSPGRECTDPVKCYIGVHNFPGGWQGFLKVVDIEVYINRGPTKAWEVYPSLPDPFRVYPDGQWTANPPGPGDQVSIEFRDRETRKLLCQSLVVNIVCEEECSCSGPGYVPVSIDTVSTPSTISPGSSITVYVDDGCPPYTWTIETTYFAYPGNPTTVASLGTGYSFAVGSTEEKYNVLNCVSGDCGFSYSVFEHLSFDFYSVVTIKVEDKCGSTAMVTLINSEASFAHFAGVSIDDILEGQGGEASIFDSPYEYRESPVVEDDETPVGYELLYSAYSYGYYATGDSAYWYVDPDDFIDPDDPVWIAAYSPKSLSPHNFALWLSQGNHAASDGSGNELLPYMSTNIYFFAYQCS